MKLGRLGWLAGVMALLALPLVAQAQDATLTGTVRDNTGGVLPGVTVTATNEAAGTTFVSVTDGDGVYRIPMRAGIYRISAELGGFQTVIRPGVELLVGRQITLNLDMAVSGLQESVTVTGEAPLLDTTSSNIAGNIDPRQMQELPLNGRNWMNLTLLAPGSRGNSASEIPQDRQGYFQINVDGQQVTFMVCCAQNQPRYSRDSIAEFELTTNRFDATKGRTQGMMVNAITKSGTNTPSGTFSGAFRDDKWNAKDFIQDRVIPYSDQQISGTFGGPIVRDRIHFFGNWEYEKEPNTITFSSQYPTFNIDQPGTREENKGGVKGDFQFTSQQRLAVRYSKYLVQIPGSGGGASSHPSTSSATKRNSDQILGDYTMVLSSNTLNQVKVGMVSLYFTLEPVAGWGRSGNRRPPGTASIYEDVFSGREIQGGTPLLQFSGYTIGSAGNTPQRTGEKIYSLRDDFTTSYDVGGRHDVKLGAEWIHYTMAQGWCNACDGTYRSTARPPANIEQLIPVWDDASTWNMRALSPLFTDLRIAIGNMAWGLDREIFGVWYQDDWKIGSRLTANMGIRYDLDIGAQGETELYEPWLSGHRPSDRNNLAPRLGFAYQWNERTVFRGGYGLFFTELENDASHQSHLLTEHTTLTLINDGRPDWAVNPFNGPTPTLEQVNARACDRTRNAPGCYQRSVTNEIPFGDHDTSYSHMASFGIQRQLGAQMSFESNFVFTGGRKDEYAPNINLSYNPATGANYPFTDLSRLPFPEWGVVRAEIMAQRSNYRGWESNFSKRFSDRWQASATYTMSAFYDDDSSPFTVELVPGADIPTILHALPFDVAGDIGGEYTLASNDQRHRATFNGIWDVGMGFQLSGLYFFGSGERRGTSYGGDRRVQGAGGSARLRPDNTIVPRNDFVGDPIHRIDMRLQKRVSLGGRRSLDGQLEVFNVFNHENFGSYTTQESNAQYGRPSFNANIAYQPRIIQLGFRFAF
jgi:hypothetical protein